MNRIINITVIAFLAVVSIACKCGWAGNFLRVAPSEDLVVKVKVLGFGKANSDIDEKMTVEVLRIFKGKTKGKKITVWGDNGMLCRPYINIFKKGDIYYLGLQKEEKDYSVSVCGEYWLHTNKGKVKMSKNEEDKEAPPQMTMKKFEMKLVEELEKNK